MVFLVLFKDLYENKNQNTEKKKTPRKGKKPKFTRPLKHHNNKNKITRKKTKPKHKIKNLQDLASARRREKQTKKANDALGRKHQKRKKSKLEEKINQRIRARLVRRLIWDEDFLCSSHNNPRNVKELFITKIRFVLTYLLIVISAIAYKFISISCFVFFFLTWLVILFLFD